VPRSSGMGGCLIINAIEHPPNYSLEDTDLPALAIAALSTTAAWADRPVTAAESEKLVAALKAEGCSGGKMEFDDGKFEVDDARCADGKKYDFDFDGNFKMTKKDLDD
jgi:hypothetical protein